MPSRVLGRHAQNRMISANGESTPLETLDKAIQDIASDYGPRTAAWVALKMEYPGY